MIENTPLSHPDHILLKDADRVLHNFVIKLEIVDESRQVEDCQDSLKRLELLLLTEVSKLRHLHGPGGVRIEEHVYPQTVVSVS